MFKWAVFGSRTAGSSPLV